MRKQEFNSKHLPSPARRGSRSRTASPPAPLAIPKASSASVESIQPRPPQPCEVGRPKGRRRKNRRQSHKFFLAPAAPASVESIQPRPPQPCEVGRPKGRRRKNRRQSHNFFFSTCCAWHPNSPPRPGEAPHPAPSARNSVIRLHRKLPSVPPASTQEVSESENRPATRGTAHSEVQGDARGTA